MSKVIVTLVTLCALPVSILPMAARPADLSVLFAFMHKSGCDGLFHIRTLKTAPIMKRGAVSNNQKSNASLSSEKWKNESRPLLIFGFHWMRFVNQRFDLFANP